MTKRVRIPITEAFRKAVRERDRGHGKPVDHDGRDEQRLIAGRRSVTVGAISDEELQKVVSRDITAVLNTVNFAAGTDLSEHQEIRRSILNYGFPDMMHRSIDEHTVGDIGDEIEWVLATFEPRLIPGSIKVARDRFVDATALQVRFVVSAELDCDPLSLPVQFFADLERDTGRIVIQRR